MIFLDPRCGNHLLVAPAEQRELRSTYTMSSILIEPLERGAVVAQVAHSRRHGPLRPLKSCSGRSKHHIR